MPPPLELRMCYFHLAILLLALVQALANREACPQAWRLALPLVVIARVLPLDEFRQILLRISGYEVLLPLERSLSTNNARD